jgi:3-oxoacyl-[acyl-carrier protein] reductase
MKLEGKVAIVTGAGRGIGRTIALELAKAGADIVIADLDESTSSQVKKEVEELGRKALVVSVNVTQWADAERTVNETLSRFGRIDILVNNAGISPKGKGGTYIPITDIEEEFWDRVMDVNLKGVFNFSKAVSPTMMKQQSGKIVNIGSIAGLNGEGASSGAYHVSKAAVICLTKVHARDLGPYNVNVNVIAPGRILTDMSAVTNPVTAEAIKKATPLGRFGAQTDISRAVLFLASDSSDFITGETLVVDGGRLMH